MTVEIKRSFLGGRTMGEAVCTERTETALMLKERGLRKAAAATVTASSFGEFFKMTGTMRAGGYHRVRLTGGRSIDG
jgi:hypothetical protein